MTSLKVLLASKPRAVTQKKVWHAIVAETITDIYMAWLPVTIETPSFLAHLFSFQTKTMLFICSIELSHVLL